MAGGLKDIRRRITSVKNTKKITYSMKLVSAAKLKRSQEAVTKSREYTKALSKIVGELVGVSETLTHPLMEVRPVKKERVIVMGASRGLCGGYNSNLNKKLKSCLDAELVILGKKPAEYLRRLKVPYKISYENLSDNPITWPIQDTLDEAIRDFIEGKIDKVSVLYTQFKSALSMTPVLEQLLPVVSLQSEGTEIASPKFEPSVESVFNALVPRLVRAQMQQAAFDAKTSEYGARMTAMDAATKNAGDLIKKLTLTANKLRQTGITSELLDIIGGAEAIS
jgi:F-type H+-transporting ATPase subunit gamma